MNGWTIADGDLFDAYGDIFVPRRSEQLDVVRGLLAAAPPGDILELGCGSGLLTAEILRARPDSRVVAVDGSAEMLRKASSRLASCSERVKFVHANLNVESWRAGHYSAVATSLAVHHLDDTEKRHLFKSVLDILVLGGLLLQADIVMPADQAYAADQWDQVVQAQSTDLRGDEEGAEVFLASRWNTFRYPDPVDQPAPVADQIQWLVEAGYEGVDVPWAFAGHAVLRAARPQRREE